MEPVLYKEYEILAKPYRLKTGKWRTRVGIRSTSGQGTKVKNFTVENELDTEKNAIDDSIEFGKKIIDGRIKNYSPA